jgi:hypothetical protein
MVLIVFVIFKPNLNNDSKTDYIRKISKKSKTSQLIDIQRAVRSIPCTNTDRNVNRANVPCEYMQKVKNRLGIFDDLGHLGMSKSELHLARLYINTIKLSIVNAFYIQYDGLIDGSAWPPAGQGNKCFSSMKKNFKNKLIFVNSLI